MSEGLLTAEQLAPNFQKKASTILAWHRTGKITADVNTGRTILFDLEKVRTQLAKSAKKPKARKSQALPPGMVPTY